MNTCEITDPDAADIKSLYRAIVAGWSRCVNAPLTWEERVRSRIALSRLAEDHPGRLADIGLTQAQVAAELAKPFWQR